MEELELEDVQAVYNSSCKLSELRANMKLEKDPDTLIIAGYGCAISVKHGALSIYPGKTHKEDKGEVMMLHRGVNTVKCIVLLSRKGMITLDAVMFCKEEDIVVIMLDHRGTLIQTLTTETRSNVMVRKSQYNARHTDLAAKIVYELVDRKVHGQLDTLAHYRSMAEVKKAIKTIQDMRIEKTYDSDRLRLYEGRVAVVYFAAFYGWPIQYTNSFKKTLPPHWLYITERNSPLTKSQGAIHAANPFHAILNYAYSLLEAQCRQALCIYGFDTACGFLHADTEYKMYRDSLVYDLMDIHRPAVDRLVLDLIDITIFGKGDFMSTKDGTVEFNPQLSRYIVASCRLQQSLIDESASWLKSLLE